MKLWLAWYHDDVEPHPIGVFSTETKAMQACEDDHKTTIHADKVFDWHYGMAKFDGYSYTVTSYELDKAIE